MNGKRKVNNKSENQPRPQAHRWLGFAACNFSMLECQTCGIIVKTKDALEGKYPICPNPHPKGCNLYKFEALYKREKKPKKRAKG